MLALMESKDNIELNRKERRLIRGALTLAINTQLSKGHTNLVDLNRAQSMVNKYKRILNRL